MQVEGNFPEYRVLEPPLSAKLAVGRRRLGDPVGGWAAPGAHVARLGNHRLALTRGACFPGPNRKAWRNLGGQSNK